MFRGRYDIVMFKKNSRCYQKVIYLLELEYK